MATAIPLELMVWLSPSFPVGAFAFSHGLEQAVEGGRVTGRESLETWLGDLIAMGSLRTDLILLAESWRAASGEVIHPENVPDDRYSRSFCHPRACPGDPDACSEPADGSPARGAGMTKEATAHCGDAARLVACNALALALQPSSERHEETVTQGNGFALAIAASWPTPVLAELVSRARDIAYPVAVGAAAAGHGLDLKATLDAYGLAFVSNLASAAIRLSIIGQTDGQRVIATLLSALSQAATLALSSTPDDIGSATFAADLASLAHETQYTRLFRS